MVQLHELELHRLDQVVELVQQPLVDVCVNGQLNTVQFYATTDSEAEVAEARDYLLKTGFRIADGCLPERTAYRRASDLGQAASETPHRSLNDKARSVFQSIIATLGEATSQKTKRRKAA